MMFVLRILTCFLIATSTFAKTSKSLGESLGIQSCLTEDIDLMFLVDSSASMGPKNFHVMLETVAEIIQYFNTNTNGHLRTALVTYSEEAIVQIFLNEYSDEKGLLNAVLNIGYNSGPMTNTGRGIAMGTDVIFREENGNRPGAFKLMFLFTDGRSQDYLMTIEEAARAHMSGISIIAIGIGYSINEQELSEITVTEEAVVIVPLFHQLKHIAATILLTICPVCDEHNGEWFYHDETCYLVHAAEEKITWLEARRRCRNLKAHLTTIRGSHDEKILSSRMSHDSMTAYIGLRKDYKYTPGTFKDIFRWEDGTPLIYKHWKASEPDGASLERCVLWNRSSGWEDMFCGETVTTQYICMKAALNKTYRIESTPKLPVQVPDVEQQLFENCTNGELVSKFKFCDGNYDCKDKSDEHDCDYECNDNMYSCQNKGCISLTFYCDGVNDCGDKSDEEPCSLKPCSELEWTCGNGQCIEGAKRCNLQSDCLDNTDEVDCDVCRGFECYNGKCIPLSWVGDGAVDCNGFKREDEKETVLNTNADSKDSSADSSLVGDSVSVPSECLYTPDMFGKVRFTVPDGNKTCTLFKCPTMFYKCPDSYCIPIFSVCNGVMDCLNGEDEESCSSFSCPGYYRCEGESNCIHPSQLCDGIRHCSKRDDERYCNLSCPTSCTCVGRIITCSANFNFSHRIPKDVRKLDLSGLHLEAGSPDLRDLHYLTALILADCGIINIKVYLSYYPNLLKLDLRRNNINHLPNTSFLMIPKLKYLDLSHNIHLKSIENGTFTILTALERLDLHNTGLGAFIEATFLGLSNLRSLNLSKTHVKEINDNSFSSLDLLHELDIRQNKIERFGAGIFNGLLSLQKMYTDNYQLCCDALRPRSLSIHNCKSTGVVISSCQDLLGQDVLKVMLWCIAVIAVLGNIMVLGYRFKYDRKSLRRSYGIFVTNLSISDCLMGVYMLIIGSADVFYRGSYIWSDREWRHSPLCKFAGFLATVSSEASCIFITLITIDRFIAIRFPFRQVAFNHISTAVSVVTTWMLAVIVAGIPLLPSFQYWIFYSKNSVCLALPLSSQRLPGWQYSSAIFVGFNFILFLLIGVGQMLIYRSVKASSKIRTGRSSDDKVARRLFLVVFTDFLCWFPVGIMGMMALQGFPINKEVFAWTAVTVLPINSALNPVLYTVPSMLQARREMMRKKGATENTKTSQGTALHRVSAHQCRAYVGNPTNDMETLRSMLEARDVPNYIKVDVISMIVTYVLDLRVGNRRLQQVTDENVFVKRCGEAISAICLSLEPDADRDSVTEDVYYLIQLLKEQGNVAEDLKPLSQSVESEIFNKL